MSNVRRREHGRALGSISSCSNPKSIQHPEVTSVKLIATPITAALAGAVAGVVMPVLWSRLATESTSLVVAFLLVVAVPAHAFVVGFGQNQATNARTVDTALLKRVGAWLLSAVVAVGIVQAVRGKVQYRAVPCSQSQREA